MVFVKIGNFDFYDDVIVNHTNNKQNNVQIQNQIHDKIVNSKYKY